MVPKTDLPIPFDRCAIIIASSVGKAYSTKWGLSGLLLWLLHLAMELRLRKERSQTPTKDNTEPSSTARELNSTATEASRRLSQRNGAAPKSDSNGVEEPNSLGTEGATLPTQVACAHRRAHFFFSRPLGRDNAR